MLRRAPTVVEAVARKERQKDKAEPFLIAALQGSPRAINDSTVRYKHTLCFIRDTVK